MVQERLLVPVSESSTLRDTVQHVAATVADADSGYIQFVFVHPPTDSVEEMRSERFEYADEVLSKAKAWAREDTEDIRDRVTIETAHIGTEEYLFDPADVAEAIRRTTRDNNIDRVVLDPEYDPAIGVPMLRPLKEELQAKGVTVREAPSPKATRRVPFIGGTTPARIGVLFAVSFVFYQVLGGSFYWFDIVTGAISGIIVAVGLSRVSLGRDPSLQSPIRLLRAIPYGIYLLWEIFKSNIRVAAVILDPRLPIEPRVLEYRPAVRGALPTTTLANSITLTPGTLTVRVTGRKLVIHTLVPWARDGIRDGGLERAVRFVFYGRKSADIGTPEERNDVSMVERDGSESKSEGDQS